MKFQSLIGRMMHGRFLWTRFAAVLAVISLSSCVGLRETRRGYAPETASPAVEVNGARVRLQLKPEGTEGGAYALSAMVVSAAAATLDGPFRWRIEATGEYGRHEALIVHRLRTRTAKTRRDEWFPQEHLGGRAEFQRKKGSGGEVRAVYAIPGLLRVKTEEDGALEVLADVTVVATGKRQRRMVRFRLEPSEKQRKEFIFLPAEIARSVGKPMEEWEETGWD